VVAGITLAALGEKLAIGERVITQPPIAGDHHNGRLRQARHEAAAPHDRIIVVRGDNEHRSGFTGSMRFPPRWSLIGFSSPVPEPWAGNIR
jgi:hypothetical protein